MRILYVVHALPAAGLGGTELYTQRIAETLARGRSTEASPSTDAERQETPALAENHDVAVATPRGHEADLEDVTVFALPDVADWTDPTGTESGLDCGVVHEKVDRRFSAILEDFRPDVVHFQHLKFLSARLPAVCRDEDVPTILTLHDFWTVCHREQLVRPDGSLCDGPDSVEKCTACYEDALEDHIGSADTADTGPQDATNELGSNATAPSGAVERRTEHLAATLDTVDVLVSPSRFLRREFRQFGTPSEQIVQHRNGIDVATFEDTGFDPDDPLRFGYAGRITDLKGVHVLLEAFASVDGDTELHLFGEFDPSSDRYHARIEAVAGPGVTFHGRYEAASEPYETMDVLVVPSVWYENSPLVIQEAHAAGVPVVAGDIGGMAELVTDGEDGLTFEVGDPSALASCLHRLVDSPETVRRLREGVESPTSTGEHARDLLDLYVACRDGRRPPGMGKPA